MPRPPSRGRVTSPFGPRKAPVPGASTFHRGEDTVGAGNFAPCSGMVVFARSDGSWGNVVGIGEAGAPGVIWWVAHHARIDVGVGQFVREGQTPLGPMGRTGTASGVHAHTERRVGGRALPGTGNATNPRLYYTGASSGAGNPIPEPPSRKDNTMTTLYNVPDTALVAMAGDSPGTPANWLETTSSALIDQWKQIHGPLAQIDLATWQSWKGVYLAPLAIAGGSGGQVPAGLATKADVDSAADRVIAGVPPAVIVEQKKPGN